MQQRSRKLVWGLVAIVAIAIAWLAVRPQAVAVDAAIVKKAPMTATVQDRGETRVVDRFVISSPVAGQLERIPFRSGDAVRRGEVVARIHPSSLSAVATGQVRAGVAEAEAAERAASARVAAARAQLEYARKESKRIAAMRSEGIAAQEALDAARNAEETAGRELEAAAAAELQASAALSSARAAALPLQSGAGIVELRAPVDAKIFAIPDRSARAVAPGEPIVTLGDTRMLEAVIDVLSEDAVKVHAGDQAQLVDWGGSPVPAIVKQVESSAFTKVSALGIEEQRVHVVVTIPDPPPALGDAYRVQGRIVIWSSPSALQIPVGALTRFGEQWGAWVIENGRAKKRVIAIGHRNDEAAEVLSGLRDGERVILHPSDDVSENVRVAPRS